jgi:ketosteroid isomerase-like protein
VQTKSSLLGQPLDQTEEKSVVNEVETKAAIREVLSAYSGAAGRLDIEAFGSFFAEDAEFHGVLELFKRQGPLKGRDQIKGFFGASFQNLEWLVQMNNITEVKLAADRKTATTHTDLIETAKRKNAGQLVMIGRYDDQLKLTSEGWRFTQRKLSVFRFGDVP